MSNQREILDQIIRNRRSIFPNNYSNKEISDETILDILENANWAPNYKKTEPWRFKVLKGDKQKQLGVFIAEYYKNNTPIKKFSQAKFDKMIRKTSIGGAMILICMQRDPEERLEEWEELAAVSMAVQNMWLSCHVLNIGAYWGTPHSIKHMDKFVQMEKGEVCLGLFFMGYLKEDIDIPQGTRGNVIDKVTFYS